MAILVFSTAEFRVQITGGTPPYSFTLKRGQTLRPRKVGRQDALAEKSGVDAADVVAFAYDIYTTPRKNNGVLGATLTVQERDHTKWKDSALKGAAVKPDVQWIEAEIACGAVVCSQESKRCIE